jgi:hypothetical protein
MSVFPSKVNFVTGDILTATDVNEIGQAINLLDGAQFAAGKNKILNADFGINQRNFTSNTATNAYNFDRFSQVNGGTGATLTVTPQTFTPGTAPVAGYEATNFVRCVTTNGSDSATFSIFSQRIEDVRTLAGQTATFSFWAKAGSGIPKVSFEIEQTFGSGGSAAVTLAASSATTISTSWTRYTITINVPSVSGKTIGTGSYLGVYLWMSAGTALASRANSIGLQTGTFDFWGLQLEAAQTASNFQTATGTKQGELAACQRYYIRKTGVGAYSTPLFGHTATTTAIETVDFLPVEMRVVPTSLDFGGSWQFIGMSANIVVTASAFAINTFRSIKQVISFDATVSATTAYVVGKLRANNDAAAYIGYSAEL